MRSLFVFTICLFCALSSFAQKRVISGVVKDAHTEELLPYISVYVPGTEMGTSTDEKGAYILVIDKPADSILFSTVGYTSVKRPIGKELKQTINVTLDRSNVMLKMAVIVAGEDPAIVVFKKIQEHKRGNNKEKLKSYQYDVYNKLEVDINHLESGIRSNALVKPFSFVYNFIDSTSEEKPYLPMYLTETRSKYYSRKFPPAKKEVILASRMAGGGDESISQFLGTMYQDINIYENRMNVLGVDFISPIASGGLFYYKYHIEDTMLFDGHLCYQISFQPKRSGLNTFMGDFWVNDTTWAIKRISMTMTEGANINFVTRMSIYQDYIPVTDSVWMCAKDKIIVDFISPKKGQRPGLIARKTTSYQNILPNNARIDTVFKDQLDIVVADNAYLIADSSWNNLRPEKLSKNELQIYKMIDTIQTLPAYKFYSNIVTTLGSGFFPTPHIEIGPWYNLWSNNIVEGYRFGLGLQTPNSFSKKVMLTGYGAYGTQDKAFKYDFKALYIPIRKPRVEIRSRYMKDVVTYNILPEQYGDNSIFGAFMRRVDYPAKLTNQQLLQGSIYLEMPFGWSNKIEFSNNIIHPYFNERAMAEVGGLNYPTYNTSEFAYYTRVAYQEKFLSGQFLRTSVGSDYPILSFEWHQSVKGVLGSDFSYQKLRLRVDDNFRTGFLGTFSYTVIAQQILNRDALPVMLLGVLPGNDTYYCDPYAFNNMNRYEFIADKFVMVKAREQFGGFPFDFVPAMKKLHWRTFAEFKSVWGEMSEKNKIYNGYSDRLAVGKTNPFEIPSKVPYMEVGTGIENIFKVFRIDFVWRLNYLDKQLYPYAAPLGVKACFQVQF